MAQAGAPPNRAEVGPALIPFQVDLEGLGAQRDQAVPDPAPETPAVGHQVQGFEHAGLARAVAADQEVDSGRRRQFETIEASQVADVEAGDVHGGVGWTASGGSKGLAATGCGWHDCNEAESMGWMAERPAWPGVPVPRGPEQPPGQSRSGITTCRHLSLLDSRTCADESASRSCRITFSSRRADNASSR